MHVHANAKLGPAGRATPHLDANRLPIRAADDVNGEGYSGYVLQGLALGADDSIPSASSNLQVLVCRAQEIILAESVPMVTAFPQTLAGSLEDVLVGRVYVGAVPRRASAVITGAAYASSQF